jgi:hypothetical protein
MTPDEAAVWPIPETLVCRWERRFSVKENRDGEEKRRFLTGVEELLLALAGTTDPSEQEPHLMFGIPFEALPVVRHLLALMLERKRLLISLAGRPGWYFHPATGQEFEAPEASLKPENLEAVLAIFGAPPAPQKAIR